MTYTFKLNEQVYKITLEENEGQIEVEIDGEKLPVDYRKIEDNLYSILLDGQSLTIGVFKKGKKVQVFFDGDLYDLESISEREQRKSSLAASGVQEIKAPMPSRVVKVLKSEGDEVSRDEGVVVIEAMKMESELKSPIAGKVRNVMAKEGDAIEAGTVLMVVVSDTPPAE
jgi:acetyl/propionyl-CoA carboxylase alpha subunit